MISEEKMTHICHLMIDGIWKDDMVDYPDEDAALRVAKRICLKFVVDMEKVSEKARRRIESQKNPPQELSPQWDNLFQKYYEEEMAKLGGSGRTTFRTRIKWAFRKSLPLQSCSLPLFLLPRNSFANLPRVTAERSVVSAN